jgi:DNA-binding response OmpR family regulator
MPHLSVLLADDDPAILEGIADFLIWRGFLMDCARNGQQALRLCQQNRYDVLVIDIMMPGLSGLSLCEQLRREGVTTPFLFLTALDQLDDKVRGFAAGADDYLVKPFAMDELACRIEALSRRVSRQQLRLLRYGPLEVDVEQQRATRNGTPLMLTPQGFTLLRHLVSHAPRLISRRELEQAIWGDTPPDSDALRSLIYQLRSQLDKPFEQPMLITRRGQGIGLQPVAESG